MSEVERLRGEVERLTVEFAAMKECGAHACCCTSEHAHCLNVKDFIRRTEAAEANLECAHQEVTRLRGRFEEFSKANAGLALVLSAAQDDAAELREKLQEAADDGCRYDTPCNLINKGIVTPRIKPCASCVCRAALETSPPKRCDCRWPNDQLCEACNPAPAPAGGEKAQLKTRHALEDLGSALGPKPTAEPDAVGDQFRAWRKTKPYTPPRIDCYIAGRAERTKRIKRLISNLSWQTAFESPECALLCSAIMKEIRALDESGEG